MLANKRQQPDDIGAEQYDPVTSNDNQATARRIPLIAALMSASLPGFGQLYNGQLNRGAWIFMIFAAICIPLTAAIALWLPVALTAPMLLLGVLLALGVWRLWMLSVTWPNWSNLSPVRFESARYSEGICG